MNQCPRERIHIRIAHGQPLIALGAAAALRDQSDFEVLLGDVDADEPASGAAQVVLADYQRGIRLASDEPGSRRRHRVMVVTSCEREQEVRMAFEQGVHGYVLLCSPVQELVAGVRAVALGSRYLCQPVAQKMADSLARTTLTHREVDVLRLLACGQCNKSIAARLDITVGTVKVHVKAIFEKLEASSRTHAASIATQRGLVGEA